VTYFYRISVRLLSPQEPLTEQLLCPQHLFFWKGIRPHPMRSSIP